MTLIEGSQLDVVQRLFGQAGAIAGLTVLQDDAIAQTLPVVPHVVRRGLTLASSSGIFTAVLENVHSAADNERTVIDPYAVGPLLQQGEWPGTVPAAWDIWIITAGIVRTAGAGDLTGGQLRFDSNAFGVGFTSDDAGAAITATNQPVLASWAVLNTLLGSATTSAAVIGTGELHARIYQRIRRGFSLAWDTTSDAAATFRLWMTLGLFPAAMGQDVAF